MKNNEQVSQEATTLSDPDQVDINQIFRQSRGEKSAKEIIAQSEENNEQSKEENPSKKTLSLSSPEKKEETSPATNAPSESEDVKDETPSIDWKKENEKIQRDLKETQRWATETKKQISAYKKIVEKFKEEGSISEDEAQELLDHTKYEEMAQKDKPFLSKAGEVWDSEIENIRKYGEYEDIDKHIHAFQHFIQNGTSEEIKDFYEEIVDLIDSNPVLFTKKMLQMGKTYHDEIFGELAQAGNLKNFKHQYEVKIDDYQKKVDKLEKEVLRLKERYEGYDETPNYRLPQGGGNNTAVQSSPDIMKNPGKVIEKFNQGEYRI